MNNAFEAFIVNRIFLGLSCVFALIFSSGAYSASNTGKGQPVSECKVSCEDFIWRNHDVCAQPDANNQGVCPLEVALNRGYSEVIEKPRFKESFIEAMSTLNKGDYFFRSYHSNLEPKPERIKITAWLDINNDGELEAVGRTFHPDYMSVVGTKFGNGNVEKGKYLYDTIDIYAKDNRNGWMRTGAIDNSVCVHARRVLPGDFNNDGFIDVVFSCHGFDNKPFPGSYSVLFLNNTDGTFTQKKIGEKGYNHAATTEDFNGDGFIDVMFYDANKKKVSVQLNNQRGGFEKSKNNYLDLGWGSKPKYYVLGAVDADGDGQFDLVAGGHESSGVKTIVYLNDGSNKFSKNKSVVIPKMKEYPDVMDIFA